MGIKLHLYDSLVNIDTFVINQINVPDSILFPSVKFIGKEWNIDLNDGKDEMCA